jgi:hypothetical protein
MRALKVSQQREQQSQNACYSQSTGNHPEKTNILDNIGQFNRIIAEKEEEIKRNGDKSISDCKETSSVRLSPIKLPNDGNFIDRIASNERKQIKGLIIYS